MKTDYNSISRTYDDVRSADLKLIDHMLGRLPQHRQLSILDVGCGTANYTDLVEKRTRASGCCVYGLDPSSGMLFKAQQKNEHIEFRLGTGDHIPWDDDFFDFLYMTDVIHHVPNIDRMFFEVQRVLKPGGKACIVTQSHEQIRSRPITHFFPATAAIDQSRYPDIAQIMESAQRASLFYEAREEFLAEEEIELGHEFLELVRMKGYSMLWLLPEEDYARGLVALEEALRAGPIKARMAGETLIWFSRK